MLKSLFSGPAKIFRVTRGARVDVRKSASFALRSVRAFAIARRLRNSLARPGAFAALPGKPLWKRRSARADRPAEGRGRHQARSRKREDRLFSLRTAPRRCSTRRTKSVECGSPPD